MDKRILYSAVAAIAVLSVILAVFLIGSRPHPKRNDYYTLEPEPWIEKTTEADYKISVSRASRGESLYDGNQQNYFGERRFSLFTYGVYQGVPFDKSLSQGEDIVMNIGPEMNPDDGIIEGFILGKYEQSGFVFYVFLDEDWKQKVGETNILYSNDFDVKSGIMAQEFSFAEGKDGIYVDKVEGDFDWFEKSPRNGGIYVGQIDPSMVDSGNAEGKTIIYLR
ncbi:MAG: hypothetical protein HGA85_00510 [Nanoarchaeota archaeon]|nr:hypothetical protein [Nanoarchaeota archaeon]